MARKIVRSKDLKSRTHLMMITRFNLLQIRKNLILQKLIKMNKKYLISYLSYPNLYTPVNLERTQTKTLWKKINHGKVHQDQLIPMQHINLVVNSQDFQASIKAIVKPTTAKL